MKRILVVTAVVACATLLAIRNVPAQEGAKHAPVKEAEKAPPRTEKGEITVTGEVLDMACYLEHDGQGEKHAACATKCIESGLPVGIKGSDGTTWLLMGDHKPLNKELAPLAAQTITVHGKAVLRDGFHVIVDAEIVKAPGMEKAAPGTGGK